MTNGALHQIGHPRRSAVSADLHPCRLVRQGREWEAAVRPHLQYRHPHHRPSRYSSSQPLALSQTQPRYHGESSRNQLMVSYRHRKTSASLPAALSLRGRLPTYRSAKSPSCSARVVSRYCCLSYRAMTNRTGKLDARIMNTDFSYSHNLARYA